MPDRPEHVEQKPKPRAQSVDERQLNGKPGRGKGRRSRQWRRVTVAGCDGEHQPETSRISEESEGGNQIPLSLFTTQHSHDNSTDQHKNMDLE